MIIDEIFGFWNDNLEVIMEIGMKILVSVIILVIGIFISKGFKRLIRNAISGKLHLDDTVGSILRYVITYGIMIICIVMILNIFGINTTSLIALLGAAGIAVGLALKDTLGNIASGISLLLLGSYKHGEFIEFDSYMGTVIEMNLFTTILETPDGIYISAPNSSIWGSPVKNYTRNGKRRMELPVRLSYFDSVDTAFSVLKDIINSESRFMEDPPAQIIVQSLQDSHVNIMIRAWTNPQDYWDIYWDQMRNIKEKIEKAGFQIPFPKRDLLIVQEKPSAQANMTA